MNKDEIIEAFVRGFNKPTVLWLTCFKPIHGCGLMKEFKRITGRKMKPFVVYPFLYMLEDKGYIVGTWMDNGRRRIKNYKVTRKGEALFSSVTKRINVYMGKMILDLFIQK